MKVVINNCFGGFMLPDIAIQKIGLSPNEKLERHDPRLVKWVEENPMRFDFMELVVVNIPDEATDYMIKEYDGAETLYCVIDGKIKGHIRFNGIDYFVDVDRRCGIVNDDFLFNQEDE